MPELIAKSPLDGQKSFLCAGCTLAEVMPGPVTSVALFPGQEKAVNKALKPLGVSFPGPNTFNSKAGVSLVWTGRDQAFLIGVAAPDLGPGAAVTDQSGGWASLSLTGGAGADALMRHIPLDLRLASFPVGRAVRVPFGHMQSVLFRTAEDSLTLMVFRSMARTAWHEIKTNLQSLAARAALV